DDDAVEVLAPDRFGVVWLPAASDIPPRTREWLAAVERAGGRVIESVAELADVAPDVRLHPPNPAVGVVHRRLDDIDVYFVANTGPSTVSFDFSPRQRRRWFECWDPAAGDAAGDVVSRTPGTVPTPMVLAPYEAAVLVGFDADAEPTPRRSPMVSVLEVLDGDWTIRVHDEGSGALVRL